MATIITNIASIFIIIAVGFGITKTKIIPASANEHFVSMLLMVTLPCMIISSITSKEFNPDLGLATIETFIVGLLFFAFTFVLGYLFCKKIIKVSPAEDLGVYIFAFSTVNNGFMGFPITQAIFGNDILYFMVLHNICLNLFLYSAGPFILNMNSGEGKFNLRYLLKTLCNPSTIVSAISIVMLFAGLHLPSMLFDTVELIGDITVPLSMLLVGMQLADSNIGRIIKNRHLLLSSIAKMVTVPVFMFLAVNWLPIDTSVKITLVFSAAFPTAVVATAIAAMENKNSLLSAEIVALTTLLSVISIPVTALFLTSYYGL